MIIRIMTAKRFINGKFFSLRLLGHEVVMSLLHFCMAATETTTTFHHHHHHSLPPGSNQLLSN